MIRSLLLGILLLLSLARLPAPTAAQDAPEAGAVIVALNAWRVQEGLWPLKPNPTLRALAEDQASYLLTLSALPEGGDIHLGRSGEQPPERARRAPYNWPSYSRPEQIALTEIAYDGRSASAALRFWKSSALHRSAALNIAYREVGVAALPDREGYLYIVVLGARPNVLPALADPAAGLLYLSDERYRFASGDRWIHNAARVRFFDAEGRPLGSGWQPWQMMLPLPPGAGDRLFVMVSDGTVEVLTEVQPQRDQVLLPAGMTARLPTPTPAAAIATVTPLPGVIAASRTPIAVPGATSTPLTIVNATPTPRATPGAVGDVTLIYDARSLSLYNSAGQALDLTGLALEQGAVRLGVAEWQTPWLSGTLTAFAARDCLQVWSWDEASDPPAPPDCRFVRGAITIDPDERPWLGGPFRASRDGTPLAACPAAPGRCSFALR